MRIISFIYKKTVIKKILTQKILTHLGVYEEKHKKAPKQRAPPSATHEQVKPVEIVPYDDGWPGYDEPIFDFF